MYERPKKYALHPVLHDAILRYEAAVKDIMKVSVEIVKQCAHVTVLETPWRDGEYFSALPARRICTSCGYEEVGSHWSGGETWSVTKGEAVLCNKDYCIVVQVDRGEFYRYRIPCMPADYREIAELKKVFTI